MKHTTIVITALLATGALTACGTPKSVNEDRKQTNNQLDRYQRNQPVPGYDYSQYRQTLLDVLGAQVHGVATTTFFFNQGVPAPVKSCPSIGFPIPSTAQLTNPEQRVGGSGGPVTVGQAEPNGVYTGESSGTYVVCVAAGGKRRIDYWEGYVAAEGGPARWDDQSKQIVADGDPTVKASGK